MCCGAGGGEKVVQRCGNCAGALLPEPKKSDVLNSGWTNFKLLILTTIKYWEIYKTPFFFKLNDSYQPFFFF